ncbi:signal peptidase I [Candidatus Photodesmus katoptron]|uniref:signal peptidase I n=1 Tax=Candidatus Photodesmus anomalopis TaxID=28176 RepID=UPI0004DA6202|nr:signal peptidase I [Candidatus Photodesmus katoptron]KEY90011.1 signal peptidase I [Candidatus Photodesmus katoptron]
MAHTFSLILVFITLLTGAIWILDRFFLNRQHFQKHSQNSSVLIKAPVRPWWIENSISIFPIVAFVLFFRSFLYEPFQIPSGSMMPTLLVGDFILVEKYSYGLKDPVWRTQLINTGKPERGDLVVFKYPSQPNIDYIKRVVGLPGDTIRYSANKEIHIKKKDEVHFTQIKLFNFYKSSFIQNGVHLFQFDEKLGDINHQILINPLRSDYVEIYATSNGINTWVVPDDQYFVMGDNRDNSSDSRYWGFVPKANLVGKAVAIWISFEFGRNTDSIFPQWIPTNIRFQRIGRIN